jgi:hypothetical protein
VIQLEYFVKDSKNYVRCKYTKFTEAIEEFKMNISYKKTIK